MKKAFASDFDNTLYFKDGFHSLDFKEIQDCQKEGILFGVCTGRSLNGVLKPTQKRIAFDFYILSTGSLLLDKNFQIIESNPIDPKMVLEISSHYSKDYHIAYNSGYDFYSLYKDYEVVKQISDISEINGPIYGISFFAKSEENAKKIAEEINSSSSVNCFHNGSFVDVTAKGCSKGKAIHNLKEKYKIDLFGAMGDSFNDISMLEEADFSYTFFSSPNPLKEKVNKVTDSIQKALRDFRSLK